jgi:hypothetical protein
MQAQNKKRICMHMKSQTLQKGKIMTSEAEQYFLFPEGIVINYIDEPDEYVFISNTFGEAKIYRPDRNQLILKSNELLASNNNSLYYFLTNQTYDLGFKDLGLTVFDSEEDGDYLVTRWQAPPRMLHQVDKIELVHENQVPIYSCYRNTEGQITLKVYFEDFSVIEGSQVPKRITEIIYLPEGDSIIKRTDFSNVRSDGACDKEKFNFKIPEDAVISK